eukprot:SAG31_NODE_7376_length_1704_cov_4.759290_2_plen_141_part_00
MGKNLDGEEATEEEQKAAEKIQAVHRGRKGRKKAKIVQDIKDKDDERRVNNPKIGEKQVDRDGLQGKAVGVAVDMPAKVAEGSVEYMLAIFGKDGGAYLRKSEQRQCRDLPMCFSFAIYWLCMIWLLQVRENHSQLPISR